MECVINDQIFRRRDFSEVEESTDESDEYSNERQRRWNVDESSDDCLIDQLLGFVSIVRIAVNDVVDRIAI